MVYYRTYRPQTIEDLDSQAVRESLTALLAGEVAHAFLFTGPKGLGKTSTARIIAKAVNCERNRFALPSEVKNKKEKGEKTQKSESIEPCNACDTCVSITLGNNLDILEIDAASNRGIDEIRDLKEKINLSPVAARKKVYIIDEVHMLTTEAFNALLKTLEEPPTHALFILCTTEMQKVPPTILSRCFHIAFLPATTEELVRSFKRITIGEGMKVSDAILEQIAMLSEGGFRDGAKILEELGAYAQEKLITQELIERKYNIASITQKVADFLLFVSQRKTPEAIGLVEKMAADKIDLLLFLQKVLERLHEELLRQINQSSISQQMMTIDQIQELVTLLSKAYLEMKTAFLPQLPIEIAVIRFRSNDVKTEGVKNELEDTMPPHKKEDEEVSVSSLRKQVGDMAKQKALYGEAAVVVTTEVEENKPEMTSVTLFNFSPDGEITKEWLEAFWKCLIMETKKYNHTVAGVLRSCKIKNFDRKELLIETAYQFHKDRLNETKSLQALEGICKGLMGKPVVVKIALKDKS